MQRDERIKSKSRTNFTFHYK